MVTIGLVPIGSKTNAKVESPFVCGMYKYAVPSGQSGNVKPYDSFRYNAICSFIMHEIFAIRRCETNCQSIDRALLEFYFW